jgi:hypothetical protein
MIKLVIYNKKYNKNEKLYERLLFPDLELRERHSQKRDGLRPSQVVGAVFKIQPRKLREHTMASFVWR